MCVCMEGCMLDWAADVRIWGCVMGVGFGGIWWGMEGRVRGRQQSECTTISLSRLLMQPYVHIRMGAYTWRVSVFFLPSLCW
jgi:hypothetical protein